jgi:hypothetical protein
MAKKNIGCSLDPDEYADLVTLSLIAGPGSINGYIKQLIKENVYLYRDDIIAFRKMVKKPLESPPPPPLVNLKPEPPPKHGLEHIFGEEA